MSSRNLLILNTKKIHPPTETRRSAYSIYIFKLTISHTFYKSRESSNDQYPVIKHVENIPAINVPI